MQLVLSQGRDDVGVGDDVHDGLGLGRQLSVRREEGLLLRSDV